jgi:hypothetical protein
MIDREKGAFRPLTEAELTLLLWIFDHGSDDLRTFRPQLEGILASPWCDCGCPSIRLQVSNEAPFGRDLNGRVIADFDGRTENGELVGVLLFQRDRRLELLEIYSIDGLAQGKFALPTLDSLRLLEWEPSPHNPNRRVLRSPE